MSNKERDETVDRLLHDAEHAVSGAWFARSIGHHHAASELDSNCERLRAEALALDPRKEAPAWDNA